MTSQRQVEASQSIAGETVGAALQHHGARLELVHDLLNDWAEDGPEALVVHAVVQGAVDRAVQSRAMPLVLHIASAREVLTELVERGGHNAVGSVEGFLHTVAMVDVDINV